MRHRKKFGFKLNKTGSHRRAMIRNMIIALITHKIIKTTLPKAKVLRCFIEPLITRGKKDSIANRRLVFSKIRNNKAVEELFTKVSTFFLNRSGGYTRILKCGFRQGDNAPIAYIELVDWIHIVSKKNSNM